MKANNGEIPMPGVQSKDVVRIGDTIRRPLADGASDVHRLLRHLEATGLAIAPRLLGIDDEGRQILSNIPGKVVNRTPANLSDASLASAATLIRQFHDATAGTALAHDQEIVMHTDLGPHNIVFNGSKAAGIIDWDEARPGSRLADFAHAAWCCADICTGVPVQEQSRKLWIFCSHYGWRSRPKYPMSLTRSQPVSKGLWTRMSGPDVSKRSEFSSRSFAGWEKMEGSSRSTLARRSDRTSSGDSR